MRWASKGSDFADTAIGAGIHPCGLDNLVASACDGAGQASTVAGDAFDDPQSVQISAGAPGGPSDSTRHSCGSGGELLGGDNLTRDRGEDGQGVVTGMGSTPTTNG